MASRSLCFVNSIKVLAGAEIWMLDAAAGLRDRGIETRFVAAPGSPLAAAAREAGFRTSEIPIRFDTAPWTLLKILRALRADPPGALICNQLKDLKAAGVAGRLAGIPRIYLTRESDFPLRRRIHYRFYLQRIATGILVNSRATLETTRLSAPWLDPGRLHLVYKGIDTERYAPRPGPPPAAGPAVVGFAGQLIPRKGLRTLMTAWNLVEEAGNGPAHRLRLAGDGPMRPDLAVWRATLRRPENVEILGQLDDMPSFYHDLQMLVLPSEQEGFGLVAAEASACGLPVVASRISSLPELVEDRSTGRLTPPGDARALADAILDLAGDPDRAATMGRAGRALVRRRFSKSDMLDALAALI